MKKTYLISYKAPEFFVLTDYTEYELEMESVWFGFIKRRKKSKYKIDDSYDLSLFTNNWDRLIKERIDLKH